MGSLRIDANDTVFLTEQLRTIKETVYKKEFPARQSLNGQFPVSSVADAGDEEIGYDIITSVGMAEIIADYADDIKRSDVSKSREIAKIKTVATEIAYNYGEVLKARKLGQDISATKGISARENIEARLNSIIWFGDDTYGLYGMLNHPSFPAGTVQTGATSGKVKWAEKTDDEILKDLSDLVDDIKTNTKGIEMPDSIAMGLEAHGVISSRRLGNTTVTLKTFFMDNHPEITNIFINPELDTVTSLPSGGAGTAGVVIAYTNSEDKISIEIPVELDILAEERRGLAWHTPFLAKIGGVLAPRPLSVNIIEGVS